MKKEEFAALTKNRIVFLDGATGSNLMKQGMQNGVCPEKWILEHSDVLLQLQQSYIKAGSNILYAPTFTCNRCKLKEYGLEENVERYNHELVAISKKAADGKAYVAGDLTMTGIALQPVGPMAFEELIGIYKEQVRALVQAGVDLFVVETMFSIQETRAAVIAIKEECDLPILATMTFEKDGKTLYGTSPEAAAVTLASLGVSAVGTNCSSGPDDMIPIVERMHNVCDLPIIAKPNAGLPATDEMGNTYYSCSSREFADSMQRLVHAGASVIGGCCGTDASFIAECQNIQYEKTECLSEKRHYLSSERNCFSFSLDDSFFVIGERINPTGKKKLQEDLKQGIFDRVVEMAEEQENNGAAILDVNFGMNGIDEKATMLKAISLLSQTTSLPLCIDSSHVDIIEEALRNYAGRALINSISFEREKYEKLLPIAKKYGAMFILLPLSEQGLPKDREEKEKIIQNLLSIAMNMGFTKEDIIVDGLVTTVGANKTGAIETLETIEFCKKMGLATTCGLSNISFGLPKRIHVNAAFLSMAMERGLTMAIANPNQPLLMGTVLAGNLLHNKKEADLLYIQNIDSLFPDDEKDTAKSNRLQRSVSASETCKAEPKSISDQLKEAVLKGRTGKIEDLTKEVLNSQIDASSILNTILIPAINEVGDNFEKGTFFLPQLIASAQAMEQSIKVLQPLMEKENGQENMPVIVIATVKGDIHDIGKNLVALMLKNYGFRVIDLGKDVSKEKIIETARENDADIIALSALMTTTMCEMKEIVALAKEAHIRAKIMIGGAVITQEYADKIDADGYSKDAAQAVVCAQKLLNRLSK